MKPLVVLLTVFVISLFATKLFHGSADFSWSGKVAMAAMLLFTAIAHFVFTKGMTMMLPPFFSYKTEIIYLTGIIEIAAAIGLFVPDFKELTAWLLITFFILILPANIFAAIHQIDYQKGTPGGNGLAYLWFRIPLQLFLILWVYLSVLKN
tara:strand:- start:1947 stop:2399 length:453 start_codon:yes stop_codon:yes gene_type:complete